MEGDNFNSEEKKNNKSKTILNGYFDEKLLKENKIIKKPDQKMNDNYATTSEENATTTSLYADGDKNNSFKIQNHQILEPKKAPLVLNIGSKTCHSLLKKDSINEPSTAVKKNLQQIPRIILKKVLQTKPKPSQPSFPMLPKQIIINQNDYKIPNYKISQMLQDRIALQCAQEGLKKHNSNSKLALADKDRISLDKMGQRLQETCKHVINGERTYILNQFNSERKTSRTIAKRVINNEEHIFTSDAITRLIGEQNYQLVLVAISNNNQDTKTRAICALLTESAPSKDASTQTEQASVLKQKEPCILGNKPRYPEVYFERVPLQRRRNMRRKTPYVIKDPPKNTPNQNTIKYSENKHSLKDAIDSIVQNSPEFNILDCNEDVPGCDTVIDKASMCSEMSFLVTPSLVDYASNLENLKPVLEKLTPSSPKPDIGQTLNVDTFGKKLQVNIGSHKETFIANLSDKVLPKSQLPNNTKNTADINPVTPRSQLDDTQRLLSEKEQKITSIYQNISSKDQNLQNDTENTSIDSLNAVDNALIMNNNAQVMWSSTMNVNNPVLMKNNAPSPHSDVNNQNVTNDHLKVNSCCENTKKPKKNNTINAQNTYQGDQYLNMSLRPGKISGLDDPEFLIKLKSEDPLNLVTLELMNILSDEDKVKLVNLQMEMDWRLCVETIDERYLPIHMAVLEDNLDLLKRQCMALKARNESVDMGDVQHNLSALHIAVMQASNLECVKILLNHDANPLERDDDDKTVLHHCTKPESEEHLNYVIWYMLRNASQILERTDLWNENVRNMDPEELGHYLLSYANEMDDNSGLTPTMEMSRLGLHSHILTLLGQMSPEQAKKAVNRSNRTSGNTALHLAIQAASTSNENDQSIIPEEYLKTIEALLKFGADLNIENYSRVSAVTMICENEFPSGSGMTALLNNNFTEYQMGTNSFNIKDGIQKLKTADIMNMHQLAERKVSSSNLKRNSHIFVNSIANSLKKDAKNIDKKITDMEKLEETNETPRLNDKNIVKVFYKAASNENTPTIFCEVLENLQIDNVMDEQTAVFKDIVVKDGNENQYEVVGKNTQVTTKQEGFKPEKIAQTNEQDCDLNTPYENYLNYKKNFRQFNFASSLKTEHSPITTVKNIAKVDALSAHKQKETKILECSNIDRLFINNNIKILSKTKIPNTTENINKFDNFSQNIAEDKSQLIDSEKKSIQNINLTPSIIEIPKPVVNVNIKNENMLRPNIIKRKLHPVTETISSNKSVSNVSEAMLSNKSVSNGAVVISNDKSISKFPGQSTNKSIKILSNIEIPKTMMEKNRQVIISSSPVKTQNLKSMVLENTMISNVDEVLPRNKHIKILEKQIVSNTERPKTIIEKNNKVDIFSSHLKNENSIKSQYKMIDKVSGLSNNDIEIRKRFTEKNNEEDVVLSLQTKEKSKLILSENKFSDVAYSLSSNNIFETQMSENNEEVDLYDGKLNLKRKTSDSTEGTLNTFTSLNDKEQILKKTKLQENEINILSQDVIKVIYGLFTEKTPSYSMETSKLYDNSDEKDKSLPPKPTTKVLSSDMIKEIYRTSLCDQNLQVTPDKAKIDKNKSLDINEKNIDKSYVVKSIIEKDETKKKDRMKTYSRKPQIITTYKTEEKIHTVNNAPSKIVKKIYEPSTLSKKCIKNDNLPKIYKNDTIENNAETFTKHASQINPLSLDKVSSVMTGKDVISKSYVSSTKDKNKNEKRLIHEIAKNINKHVDEEKSLSAKSTISKRRNSYINIVKEKYKSRALSQDHIDKCDLLTVKNINKHVNEEQLLSDKSTISKRRNSYINIVKKKYKSRALSQDHIDKCDLLTVKNINKHVDEEQSLSDKSKISKRRNSYINIVKEKSKSQTLSQDHIDKCDVLTVDKKNKRELHQIAMDKFVDPLSINEVDEIKSKSFVSSNKNEEKNYILPKNENKKRSINATSKSVSEKINKEDVSTLYLAKKLPLILKRRNSYDNIVKERSLSLARSSIERIEKSYNQKNVRKRNSKEILQIKVNKTPTATKKQKSVCSNENETKKKNTIFENKFIPISDSESDNLAESDDAKDQVYQPPSYCVRSIASKKTEITKTKSFSAKRIKKTPKRYSPTELDVSFVCRK